MSRPADPSPGPTPLGVANRPGQHGNAVEVKSPWSMARAAVADGCPLGSASRAGRHAVVHAKGRPALVVDGEQVEAQVRRVADEQRQAACDDYRLEG